MRVKPVLVGNINGGKEDFSGRSSPKAADLLAQLGREAPGISAFRPARPLPLPPPGRT